ncbi:C-type lectin domain family 2 member F-like isoform X1 [Aquarana catesbeiana]|uniref:C-type lectin domain family 2 member F-like isoform X1 n=1 Tax=Aquarana catesbeiana TaxID=8400 RepID=UPI003CC93829
MGIREHEQKSDIKAELEGYSTPFTNRYLEKAEDYHEQGYSTPFTDIDREMCADNHGSSTPFTYRDPEMCADNHDQGIWQKLRSHTVPSLCVIVGAAISVTVIIILAALLSVRGDTPERKVVNSSTDVQCKDGWILYEGKCYYISVQRDTWTNSQNFCKSHNSSLAIIDNEKELNFLNLLKFNKYWIGLSRTQDDSGWVWTDGTLHSETLFNIYRIPAVSGESENVFLNGDGFRSHSGRYLNKYICSKSFLGHPH